MRRPDADLTSTAAAAATAGDDLVAFLGEHAPFDSMSPAALATLVDTATVHTFTAGELIVDYVSGTPDEIWVLHSGVALLLADIDEDSEPVDTVEPGGVFGYLPLLSEGAVAFTARAGVASVAVRLPGHAVRSVFAAPAGLSYLATTTWDAVASRPRIQRTAAMAVAALVPGEPVFTTPDTPVRDAVAHMSTHRASYVLVRMPGRGLGIFTDRDLRSRVVGAGVDLDVPIREVMTCPVRTAPADRIGSTVLMDMLEYGIRHMPVTDRRGRVLGVVEESDLVASSTRKSFAVRRSIALAGNAGELAAATSSVTDLAITLFRGGTDAASTSTILSLMIDAIVRRALDLALEGRPEARRSGFAWLIMGSVARREAMLSSDVDSALSWADDATDPAALRALAGAVHGTLSLCGLPADSNGAVASAPRFSRSAGQWTAAARGWLAQPLHDRGIIMASLLVDSRVICGNPTWNTAPAVFARMPADYPDALRLQILDALSAKPRVRSLRDVAARRGGTLDLKSHAVTPIVNLARWVGLLAGTTIGSTPDRLAAAAGHELLTEGDAAVLVEVFELLQRLRMSHQIDQLAAGLPPSDIVTLSALSPLSRAMLTDGIREILAVQRRVRTVVSAGATTRLRPGPRG